MTRYPLFASTALTMFLTGCPSPPTDGNSDSGHTGETGDPGNPATVYELGDCHTESELKSADSISFDELPTTGFAWDASPAVIKSQSELDAWHADHEMVIDASGIDFSSQSILFSQVNLGSTCGADDPVIHVVKINQAPHLSLELTNPSGACEVVCDMTWTDYKVVAVDKIPSHPATVCARQIETCRED